MDIFNKEKLTKLEKENIEKSQDIINLQIQVKNLQDKINTTGYKDRIQSKRNELKSLNSELSKISSKKSKLSKELNSLIDHDITDISSIDYFYDFSPHYKQAIDNIRNEQKQIENVIILSNYSKQYIPDNLYNSIAHLMQSHFDIKCDEIMQKVTYLSKDNLSNKIYNLATRIERNLFLSNLTFNKKYIDLKVKEIYLVFEYKCKERVEKQQRDKEAEILRDQAKADKEIKKELEKEEKRLISLQYKYNQLIEKGKDTGTLQNEINMLQASVNFNNQRLTKEKSGYVYVVGNRDMRKGLYKIGITKRNVEKRMSELGGASHSFPMEVYGYVFVDDCYKIEAQLHNHFKNKRLNTNNRQKEWFITSLGEIKQAFKKVCDIDIDLSEKPCEDYLKSYEKFVDFY